MDRPLTQNITPNETAFLPRYENSGGYLALRDAVTALGAEKVLELVKDSGLRGRGGAGFPTGLKWSFVPRGDDAPKQKYAVANADEMEPGAFKDRFLIEGDPHQLIEGLALSAFALGAKTAYIYMRGEYSKPAQCITRALAEAYEKGYLGKNIFGSDYSLEMMLHRGAGRYICGEETALLNSLEGKRAVPRSKPPFPQVSGAWGKPTIVNNVETLCNVPHIVRHGVEWYQSLGQGNDAGTKIFGVSGRVNNPGAWELPMGVSIREIFEKYAGGMQQGLQLKGFLPGGGSTDFLVSEHLDLAMDYDVIGKAGSRMGTGTMIVLDDKTCPVGMVLNLIRFFSQESCGWCTPCRDGLPWTQQLLETLEQGKGGSQDLVTLQEMTRFMAPGNTFCPLAPGAVEPLQSALKYFYDDFTAHVHKGCCPYH